MQQSKKMEACFCKHLQPIVRNIKLQYLGWNGVRSYSQYRPHFQEASVQKEKLEKVLQEKSEIEIKTTSYKAAKSDTTCSIFFDADVNKFTNFVMKDGKKALARKLVEDAFTWVKHIQLRKYNSEEDEEIKSEICIDPLKIFHDAVTNASPKLQVVRIRKSGSWYKVPTPIKALSAKYMAMKWLIEVSNEKKPKQKFYKILASELVAAYQNEGRTVNKKIELHKLCEANKSYAHYRWS